VKLRRQLPVYSPLTLGAVAAAAGAVATGSGPAELERRLCTAFGSAAVVLTDCGTSALALALRAAGRPAALPAYGCYDLATAADGAGVDVLLYDVDPRTLGPDFESLEAVLRAGAGTVVVASLFGLPIDLDVVTRQVIQAGAVLVEDAAQAIGMSWHDRPAGATGTYGVLSFGRGKGVTGGGGGALLLNTPEAVAARDNLPTLVHPGRGLKAVAALAAQWALARPSLYAIPAALPLGLGQTRYLPVSPPAGISPAAAAAVVRTLSLAPADVALRQRNASRLIGTVKAGRRLHVVEPADGGRPSYLRLPVIDPLGGGRFAEADASSLGVMPGYPLALCDLNGFGGRIRNPGTRFSGARALAAGLGTLPTHSLLTEADLLRLEEWLRRVG